MGRNLNKRLTRMIHSMTGFASLKGHHGAWSWSWDIRSVNARGLDLRLRLPDWLEGLEPAVRKAVTAAATRGAVSVGLRLTRDAGEGGANLNAAALERVLAVLAEVDHEAKARGLALSPPSLAEVAAMRGVLETSAGEEDTAPLLAALVADLPELLDAFNAMRRHEGAALKLVLEGQLAEIAALVEDAEAVLDTRRDAQADNLRTALARVTDNLDNVDPDRVAQELALIAVKTDVREELDRLAAHVEQARSLLEGDEPRGRKLDFLMQEFNREANTLCSKSQFQELTRIGLDLKAVVDQMREQVQNVE